MDDDSVGISDKSRIAKIGSTLEEGFDFIIDAILLLNIIPIYLA